MVPVLPCPQRELPHGGGRKGKEWTTDVNEVRAHAICRFFLTRELHKREGEKKKKKKKGQGSWYWRLPLSLLIKREEKKGGSKACT